MREHVLSAGLGILRVVVMRGFQALERAVRRCGVGPGWRVTIAAIALLGCAQVGLGQLWFDLDGDGFGDRCDSELRSDAFDPVVSRIVVYSGMHGGVLLARPSDEADDLFGHTVTSMGDLDGDGVLELAVAAPGSVVTPGSDGQPALHRGRVHLISGADGAVRGVPDGGGRGAASSVPDHLGSDTQAQTGASGVGMRNVLPDLGPRAETSVDSPHGHAESVVRTIRNMRTYPKHEQASALYISDFARNYAPTG